MFGLWQQNTLKNISKSSFVPLKSSLSISRRQKVNKKVKTKISWNVVTLKTVWCGICYKVCNDVTFLTSFLLKCFGRLILFMELKLPPELKLSRRNELDFNSKWFYFSEPRCGVALVSDGRTNPPDPDRSSPSRPPSTNDNPPAERGGADSETESDTDDPWVDNVFWLAQINLIQALQR